MGLGKDLNNIAKAGWDYVSGVAGNIARNASVENLEKGYNAYIKRSPEELANVARATMQRKNTVMSNLNMADFDTIYNAADKSNAEYVKEFNKLRGALNSNNVEEAKATATSISERFQDGAYLKLLQDAEGKVDTFKSRLDSMDAETIREAFINETKEKITSNKILGNFTDDGEWLADKAYKLNPRSIPAYFTTENKKTNRIRTGVIGGAYMGGAMVVRGLQGGTPMTNEYGQRDIAGIPFI